MANRSTARKRKSGGSAKSRRSKVYDFTGVPF